MREIALHILDVLQNAVEAGATQVALTVDEDAAADRLSVTVVDNGRGMDAATLGRVADPFYTTRTTRHVGLGLPLLAAACERAGGRLEIRSQPRAGTTVVATFRLGHPDRQPLGDMPATLLSFVLAADAPALHYIHRANGRSVDVETGELRAALGGIPLCDPVVRAWLAEALAEAEQELDGEQQWQS